MKKEIFLCTTLLSVALLIGIIFSQTWYEILACLLGIVYLIFFINKVRYALLCGSAFMILNGIIAFHSSLWASTIISFFYLLPVTLISFFKWEKTSDVKIKFLTQKQWLICFFVLFSLSTILFFVLKALSDSQPLFDGIVFTLTILSGFLMVYKFREMWIFNIACGFFSIALWIINFTMIGTGLNIILIQTISVFLSFYGFFRWKKQEAV